MALLTPDLFYSSLASVDVGELSSRGVRGLLIDLDNTLVPRNSSVVPESSHDFADRVSEAGMRACLVSNNWHARVSAIAGQVGFSLVPRALKPLPFGFRRALGLLGVRADEAAVIGDQVFTDVLGGNALGLVTVLVPPLSSADLPHTLLLRRLESRVLAGRQPLDQGE